MTFLENHSRRKQYAYGAVFVVLGVLTSVQAFLVFRTLAWGLAVGWLALDFLILGAAYFMSWPRVFGKSSDGSLRLFPAGLMLPFLIFTWVVWWFQNRMIRTPTWAQLTPTLFLGRRCAAKDLPPGISMIVDVTAEFPVSRTVRAGRSLLCAPVLDGCAPLWTDCLRICDSLQDHPQAVVYLYCANGHGRSATIAAVLLGMAGVVESAEQAVALIKQARPTISLNVDQRTFLNGAFQQIRHKPHP